jgi:hypothetical protein
MATLESLNVTDKTLLVETLRAVLWALLRAHGVKFKDLSITGLEFNITPEIEGEHGVGGGNPQPKKLCFDQNENPIECPPQ